MVHDYSTGMSRGGLCQRCNVMLGYAADSPERLTEAAAYIGRTGGRKRKPRNSRAAYMREYRARRQMEASFGPTLTAAITGNYVRVPIVDERIANLEAEVARLKRELAARPVGPSFNAKPFTPVPKGK